MLLPVQQQPNNAPPCFAGRNDLEVDSETGEPILLWSPSAPECRGGLDMQWKDERTGSHLRPECGHYRQCGAETQAKRATIARLKSQGLLPASQLTSKAFPPTSSVQPPPAISRPTSVSAPTGMTSYLQTMLEYQKKLEEAQKLGKAPSAMGIQQAPTGYQAMMPVNFHMPAYLSVPEIQSADEGILPVLGREVARGLLKAFGHSLSTFFDNRPWRR